MRRINANANIIKMKKNKQKSINSLREDLNAMIEDYNTFISFIVGMIIGVCLGILVASV